MILDLDSQAYRKHVASENENKLIYTVVLRDIYRMNISSPLFYRKFCVDLENIGFEFNPYNPCVSNRIKVGKQHTVRFLLGDIMSSHMNPKVNKQLK